MCCAKTAEPVEMQFGTGGSREHVLHGDADIQMGVSEQFLNGTSAHYRLFSARNGG